MLSADAYEYPSDLIKKAVNKMRQPAGSEDQYIIKVRGKEDFLLGNYPLSQFIVRISWSFYIISKCCKQLQLLFMPLSNVIFWYQITRTLEI